MGFILDLFWLKLFILSIVLQKFMRNIMTVILDLILDLVSSLFIDNNEMFAYNNERLEIKSSPADLFICKYIEFTY